MLAVHESLSVAPAAVGAAAAVVELVGVIRLGAGLCKSC